MSKMPKWSFQKTQRLGAIDQATLCFVACSRWGVAIVAVTLCSIREKKQRLNPSSSFGITHSGSTMGKKGKRGRRKDKAGGTNGATNGAANPVEVAIFAVAERFIRRSSASPSGRCLHGAPPNMKDVAGITSLFGGTKSVLVRIEECAEVLAAEFAEIPEATKKAFLAIGTEILLDPQLTQRESFVGGYLTSHTLIQLETKLKQSALDPGPLPAERECAQRCINLDSHKRIVKYFARRAPCNCLANALEAVQDNRTGRCSCCRKIVDDDANELRDCSRCHLRKYCGRECQLKDWPEHKDLCKYTRKKLAEEAAAAAVAEEETAAEEDEEEAQEVAAEAYIGEEVD